MAKPVRKEIGGDIISLPIKADLLNKESIDAFRRDSEVAKLQAGVLVTIAEDGSIAVAENKKAPVGMLLADVAGYELQNCPAYASGHAAVIIGTCIVELDNVKENDIKAGDVLYVDTTSGVLSKTKSDPQDVYGIALTANSSADKTIKVKLFN